MTMWSDTAIAADGTHHIQHGKPLYAYRFAEVLKFHAPGLAAVLSDDGAYHIDVHGRPGYTRRFSRVFGFYEERAAVSGSDGWHHVLPDGADLYPQRYAWCGNYQGGRATVRSHDGLYLHLCLNGQEAYPDRYLYAGDFRDGIGCVRRQLDGRCIHIDPDGRAVHPRAYLDLDVFHKGLARARDESGWFHVRLDGMPAYEERFAAVEPFYNGKAFCESQNGRRVIVNESGQVEHSVWSPIDSFSCPSGLAVLVVGNIGAGKSTVTAALSEAFGWPRLQIDAFRQRYGDGTAAGELSAWAALVRELQCRPEVIVEFSGSGPFAHLVQHALEVQARRHRVLWIKADVEACKIRSKSRSWSTPSPDFGVPIHEVITEIDVRLAHEIDAETHWRADRVALLDGNVSATVLIDTAVAEVRRWLAGAKSEEPCTH